MPPEPRKYRAWKDVPMRCPFCQNDTFFERRVNLASPATEFLNLEILSPAAQALTCSRCHFVMLFEDRLDPPA